MGRLQLCNRVEHGRSHGRQNKVLEIKPSFVTLPFPRLTMKQKFFALVGIRSFWLSEGGNLLERVIGDRKIDFIVCG